MFLKLLQYLPETKELGHPDDESMFFCQKHYKS